MTACGFSKAKDTNMISTKIKIGPQDEGRPMSLAEFEPAQVEEGYIYELSRGIITVSDVASFFPCSTRRSFMLMEALLRAR